MEVVLRGIGVSPGIAIGPALNYRAEALEIPKYPVSDKKAELTRFEQALEGVRSVLRGLREQTAEELGERHADIFHAHLMILDDVTLREEIQSRLESEGVNVEYIIDEVITRYARLLSSVDDLHFRERARDIVDVGTRILKSLLHAERPTLEHLERPSIILAHDLTPSDTVNLDLVNTLGLATDVGGPTSHTAILARALEIPAVVSLRSIGETSSPGDMIILDGTRGRVIVRPAEATLARYAAQKQREEEERKALASGGYKLSVTLDGYEVPILANIELPIEVAHGLSNKAQGVGLFRTEYLFLNRHSAPSEEEQYEAYAQVAEAFKPNPVTLRTLDLGGDKFAARIHFATEMNPQLGWRAIRLCLERPDIFKAQLRAMFRASIHGDVQVMFPMISGVDEFERVMEVVREVLADLERRGMAFNRDIKIGTMIEVPSAVAVADLLARRCDFFSIGTNDLIQYALAVDRINEKIAHMYEPAHPAVIRMISQTTKAAKEARIPCGICGEMAGDPLFTELLMGLGVDTLSMSAVAIPVVRAEIANSRMATARRFAKRVLSMTTTAEIKSYIHKRFKTKQTLKAYLDSIGPEEEKAGR